jgi:uncharacterized protein (DUF2147 family)
MRQILVAAMAVAFMCGSAGAAEPTGEWLTEKGEAQVRIENCSGQLWGVVSWEKEPGSRDTNNPDPTKRNRPILGMPLLIGLKPSPQYPGRWQGEIYNSQNGKVYDARIQLVSDDVLKLEGCVLGGLFCGGQNWTRVKQPQPAAAPARPGAPAGARPAAAAASSICSTVTGSLSGPAH